MFIVVTATMICIGIVGICLLLASNVSNIDKVRRKTFLKSLQEKEKDCSQDFQD